MCDTLTLRSIPPHTERERERDTGRGRETDWTQSLLDLVLRFCLEVWIMVEPTSKPAAVLLLFVLHSCLADHGNSHYFLVLLVVVVVKVRAKVVILAVNWW